MDTVSYQCPNCGGSLIFDPEQQKYHCEYCISYFTEEELETKAQVKEALAEKIQAEEATVQEAEALLYHCPSCGAEIVTDDTTAATFCFYCHNPVVLKGRLDGEYRPDYVIPFAISREQALERFEAWIRNKRFVPKDFYAKEQIEKLSGVYFPYLLYSCQVEGGIEAGAFQKRVWRTGNLQYTETKQYQVSREGTMEVCDVTRNALKKADRELIESVLPYHMKEKKPFSMAYLSGFLAEKRDMGKEEFEQEMKEEVSAYAAMMLKNSISGYDEVEVQSSRIDMTSPKWEYAMMPVWTLTYQDETDHIYYFALNGQTGKICGELPVDSRKLKLLFAAVFFPVLICLLAVGYLI